MGCSKKKIFANFYNTREPSNSKRKMTQDGDRIVDIITRVFDDLHVAVTWISVLLILNATSCGFCMLPVSFSLHHGIQWRSFLSNTQLLP